MGSIESWTTPGGTAAITALLWTVHHDMAGLREGMARLEGSVDALAKFLIDCERGCSAGKA